MRDKTAWAHTCPFNCKTKCSSRIRIIITYKNLKYFSLFFRLLEVLVHNYHVICNMYVWVIEDELSELIWKEWNGWDSFCLIDNHSVLGFPKNTSRFGNLLGGLTGLSICSDSWLWFITVVGYRVKLVKGKVHGANKRKPNISFQESFPSRVTQNALNSSSNKL